jgi:hypothetical protein
VDSGALLRLIHELIVRAWGAECRVGDVIFIKEAGKEVEKLIPLSTLFFERENAYYHSKNFEMEHKVVQMLSSVLLSNNLEIALLQPLEIKSHIASQKVEAILYRLDFPDHQLNNF